MNRLTAQDTLGKILNEPQDKDAVHIPVICVRATIRLLPGQQAGVDGDGNNPIGIVDPYLDVFVEPGQYFWLCITPRTVTSLRHDWVHPGITSERKQKAITWLQNFADDIAITYDELLDAAKEWVDHGEYLSNGGKFEGVHATEEFWDHYMIVTDTIVESDNRHNFFKCSC